MNREVTMRGSKPIIVLCVALGVLGAASVADAAGKSKALHAHASAVGPSSVSALDALAVQHQDKNWDHRYQSWCDVDPACNGWNQKMLNYERSMK
jgi:hypothetical protein